MTHEQAIARCEELNRAGEGGRRWFVAHREGEDWQVVRADFPGLPARGSLHEAVESRPEPRDPPDPRSSLMRNIPPYGA
jgi:hypothetical protein